MGSKLTPEQEELLAAIPQELRRETALAFVARGYDNQKQSYLDACRNTGRKPSKNPEVSACEILRNANVQRFLNSLKISSAEATKTNAEYVLRRLREIDELDIIDIVTDDLSAFRPLSEWPKCWRISISGFDLSTIASGDDIETVIKKIKWPDKVKNLEMIGRHVEVKAWDKEVEVTTVTNNIMPVPVADSVESWEEVAQKQQRESLKNV